MQLFLHALQEDRTILDTIWLGHVLRRSGMLCHTLEGRVLG